MGEGAKLKLKSFYIALALIGLSLLFVSSFGVFGIYINLSPSLPVGLYKKATPLPLQNARGGVVMLKKDSIPSSKKYAGNRPLIKRIIGVPGDVFEYDNLSKALYVNNTAVLNSEIFITDGHGDELPQPSFPITVPEGHVWLGSDINYGFDSRYFGTVPMTSINSFMKLIYSF